MAKTVVMFKVDQNVFEEVPTCVPGLDGQDSYATGILDVVFVPSDSQNPQLLSLLKAIKKVIPHSMPPWAWWTSNGVPLNEEMWAKEWSNTLILTGGRIPPKDAVFWSTCSNPEEAASRVEVYETELAQSMEAGVKRSHLDSPSPECPSKRLHVTSEVDCPSCNKKKHPDGLVPRGEDYICVSCSIEEYGTALGEFDQRISKLEASVASRPLKRENDPEFAARTMSLCPWRGKGKGKMSNEEADKQAREVGRELRHRWTPESIAFVKIVATVLDEEGEDALPPPMEIVEKAKLACK